MSEPPPIPVGAFAHIKCWHKGCKRPVILVWTNPPVGTCSHHIGHKHWRMINAKRTTEKLILLMRWSEFTKVDVGRLWRAWNLFDKLRGTKRK